MQTDLLKHGIAAAEAGKTEIAGQLLSQVVAQDPHSEMAWWWLSKVAEDPEQRIQCLQRVLSINPQNTEAKNEMKALKLATAFESNKAPFFEPEPAEMVSEQNGSGRLSAEPDEPGDGGILSPSQLRFYIQMLRRSWWLVALTTLVALAASLYFSYIETPMYRTSARYVVSPTETLEESRDVVAQVLSLNDLMATYAEIFHSQSIVQEASARLQIEPEILSNYEVLAVVLPEANVVELSVSGPEPQITALLANGIGQEAVDYIKAIYQFYDINLLDPAPVPDSPFSPNAPRSAGLSAVLGLVLGAALATLRERLLMVSSEKS